MMLTAVKVCRNGYRPRACRRKDNVVTLIPALRNLVQSKRRGGAIGSGQGKGDEGAVEQLSLIIKQQNLRPLRFIGPGGGDKGEADGHPVNDVILDCQPLGACWGNTACQCMEKEHEDKQLKCFQ